MKKVLFLLVMIAAFVACSKDDDNSGDNDIVDNEEVSFKIDSIVYDDVRFGVGRVYRIDCYPSDNRKLLSYEWYIDGHHIANDEYYTLFLPSEVKTYNYKVSVRNIDGSVATKEFSLTVTPYDYAGVYWGEKRESLIENLDNAKSYPKSVGATYNHTEYLYYLNDKDEFYKGEEQGKIKLVSSMIEGLYTNQHLRIFESLKSKYGDPKSENIEGDLTVSDEQKGRNIYNRKLKFEYTFSNESEDVTYIFPTGNESMLIKYTITTEHK